MSYHIHINDEAGLWSCSGPYESINLANREALRVVDKRQDGPWKKIRGTNRWIKKGNNDHYIEVVSR